MKVFCKNCKHVGKIASFMWFYKDRDTFRACNSPLNWEEDSYSGEKLKKYKFLTNNIIGNCDWYEAKEESYEE